MDYSGKKIKYEKGKTYIRTLGPKNQRGIKIKCIGTGFDCANKCKGCSGKVLWKDEADTSCSVFNGEIFKLAEESKDNESYAHRIAKSKIRKGQLIKGEDVSMHGIHFDLCQSGNCSMDCEKFLDGDCEAASEFNNWLESMDLKTRQEQIESYELLSLYPGIFDHWKEETMEDRVARITNQIKKEG